MVRSMLAALGLFVIQMLRLRLYQLHTTTLAARAFILAALAGCYVESGNPMFISLIGVVGLGFALTFTGVLLDRRGPAPATVRVVTSAAS